MIASPSSKIRMAPWSTSGKLDPAVQCRPKAPQTGLFDGERQASLPVLLSFMLPQMPLTSTTPHSEIIPTPNRSPVGGHIDATGQLTVQKLIRGVHSVETFQSDRRDR
jgi:hypothetical protein